MNAANRTLVHHVLADIETGALTEVPEAANAFYNEVRGLTERQQFFIYPDGRIVALNYCDGTYRAYDVAGDDEVIFMHLYPQYFVAQH